MLICERTSELQPTVSTQEEYDWLVPARSYPNIEETASFISQQQQQATPTPFTTTAIPENLQGRQHDVYDTVKQHYEGDDPEPLHIIINGTAGTGKSYLINCLRLVLLGDSVKVAAPTGVASFIIEGRTLHSLLHLPVRGDFKEMEGNNLQKMQEELSSTKYLIIDEMSMVGRKVFGMIDRRLRQAFPCKSQTVFGGCSVLLFGDFGQLPPVMDLPLYTTVTRSDLSDQGYRAYSQFEKAFTLTQVMRQAGQDLKQIQFRDILLHLRNAEVTREDWQNLMEQTPTIIQDLSPFVNALQLFPTVEAVVEHNVAKLRECGQPIAINAVHTGPNASKASPDDAGGLEPVIMLARTARVMLTSNLWVEVGLVNGAMGTVEAICYLRDTPPHLPVAVMIRFDHYTGPTMHDGTVPITPMRRTWSSSGGQCSRLQLPLKLAWAVTIHKSQGLTLDKVVIDVGKKEFSCGLTFVACSRVRKLTDILFTPPFPLQRLTSIANSQRLRERKEEDQRLLNLQEPTSEPSLEDTSMQTQPQDEEDTSFMEWMTPSPPTPSPPTPSPPSSLNEDEDLIEWMTPPSPTPSPPSPNEDEES